MSSIQQTIDDLVDVDEDHEEVDERPAWTPGKNTSQRECLGCGAHVTDGFARTHGDEDGRVHRCVQCAPQNKLQWLASGQEPRPGGGAL